MKILSLFLLFFLASCATSPKSATPLKPAALPEDSIYQIHSQWFDQTGRTRAIGELRGKAVVISMVYLKCRFACPMTVANMKDIQEKLPPEFREKVSFVLISFDPENDTPAAMQDFANSRKLMSPPWLLLSSKNESDIRELSVLLDFRYKKLPDGEFEHSFSIIALDPDGRVLSRSDGAEMKPMEVLATVVKSLQ